MSINVCTFVACMQDVRVITCNYNYNITITQGYSCVHVVHVCMYFFNLNVY